MKKVKLIFILFCSVAILLLMNKHWALTRVNIPFFSVPNGKARVDFINNSSDKITEIGTFTTRFTDIKPGQRVSDIFELGGELGYSYYVQRSTDDSNTSSELYLEGGYFVTVIINDSAESTKFGFL